MKGFRTRAVIKTGSLALSLAGTFAGCAASPTSPPTATAPSPAAPVARLSVMVDQHGSTEALAGGTAVTFDLSESIGSGLRYNVDFGDGPRPLP